MDHEKALRLMSLILKIALNLLPALPALEENIAETIAEIQSSDDGLSKLKGVVGHLKSLVDAIETAIS